MPIFMRPAVSVLSSFSKISSGSIDTRDVVVPGQLISFAGDNLITGHGTFRNVDKINTPKTFTDQEGSLELSIPECQNLQMRASLAGRVKAVNKLVYVEPLKARYSGNIGETIVGRIIEVEQRRWRVDVNSFQVANLSLANVKLPGGEMRRKSEDDERAMRSYIKV
ncbi:unnamed protein product [Protopolystoma xenopodis]|uniref:RRP4 S1 domain-containing protein n=1 Tax=Protopolystoma xenopodis TaxID=117903 RepID=A0A448X1E5_9PLAT|nr:unnamed protein product [Protopolystoma xenopodis]